MPVGFGIPENWNIRAAPLNDLINEGQVRVTLRRNDLAGLVNSVITKIWIHDNLFFFKGKESTIGIITELPCLGDLDNQGQLPVQEVLEGTDDCVS